MGHVAYILIPLTHFQLIDKFPQQLYLLFNFLLNVFF